MPNTMDQTYGHGNGRELQLDIYRPESEESLRTAVLMFHGGGWRRGSRKSLAPHAELLRVEGFTAMPAEYRLLDESPWPAAVHDVKAAIRWVRANAAELGVEADRIVLEGFSAGAHLALMAAGTVGNPDFEGKGGNPGVGASVGAVAAFFPTTLLHAGETRQRGSSPAIALLGEDADAEAARSASPLSYVSDDFPPVFFLHGGADRVVPTSASIVMQDALRAAGVETDLHTFAGQNHEFVVVDVFRELVVKEVSLFFRRMVSQKEEIAARAIEQSPFAKRAAEAAARGARG